MKPGKGWKHLGGSVYQCGHIRLHLLGLAKTADGEYWANAWPESKAANRFIRINGGNRKRGLMAWANHKALNHKK